MKQSFKLLICLLALLLSTLATKAQMKIFGLPIYVSFEAGYSDQLRHGPQTSDTHIQGIRLASLAELSLPLGIRLHTGAIYNSTYSHKTQGYYKNAYVYSSSFGHSINVPLYAGYELPLFSDFSLFGFAGPALSIGLSEHRLTHTVNMTKEVIDKIKKSGYSFNYTAGKKELYSAKELKSLNWMLSAGGGIRFRNYYVKSGYDFGLTNINAAGKQYISQSGWYVLGGFRLSF